jgi:hypothetical protein
MKMVLEAKKRRWLIAGVAALALAAVLYVQSGSGAGTGGAAYADEAAKNVITVTGQGEMSVKPDVAYVNVGIRTEAPTAKEAQSANAEAFTKLRSVLFDQYKLAEKDVQTVSFNVQPVYSYTDKEPVVKGYAAVQTVQVTYRDLDKLGTFLDDVSAGGANQIDGVRFSTEKGQEYELQVIEKAMDNAKAKAEAIAKYAGKELKSIVSVSQGAVAVPVAYSGIGLSAKTAAMDAASTSILIGELKVSTTVTVQYEF